MRMGRDLTELDDLVRERKAAEADAAERSEQEGQVV
jgi:hypothetical protein